MDIIDYFFVSRKLIIMGQWGLPQHCGFLDHRVGFHPLLTQHSHGTSLIAMGK